MLPVSLQPPTRLTVAVHQHGAQLRPRLVAEYDGEVSPRTLRAVSHLFVAAVESMSATADPWDVATVSGYQRGTTWSGVQLVLDVESYAHARRAEDLLWTVAACFGARHGR